MKVNSKYRLFMQTNLSSSDFKVLALLYQPIIGLEPYALYSTLYNMCKQTELMSHRFILDVLNIKQADFIVHREKLEAVGLLETYQKNENEYIYILKPPFTAKQFLIDTFLGAYLESEVGQKNFEMIVKMFEINKPVLNHLDNLTKSFDDLYEFKANKLLNIKSDFEGKNGVNTNLVRKNIDYELFIEKLPRALKGTSLFNDNFKQKVLQLAYVYHLSIDDLVIVYTNAHKGRNDVTIDQLNFQAKVYFEQNQQEISVVSKETSEEQMITSVPLTALVERFSQGDGLDKANYLSTVHTFINQNDIDDGVLKILVLFILKNKNGILPHVNYLNKVWQSWSKNGVQTVEDAIKHRENLEKAWSAKGNNNQNVTYKTASKSSKPDWLDDYIKEISEMEG